MRKNRTVKMLIMVGVLVLAICAVLAAKIFSDRAAEETAVSETEAKSYPVYVCSTDDLTAFTYSYSTYGDVSLEKRDGVWYYTGDAAFPVNQTVANSMAVRISGMTADKRVENTGAGTYGIDEPSLTITVGDDRIVFGSESSISGSHYVSNGDGYIYLVSNDVMNSFNYTLSSLMQFESVPKLSNATWITVVKGDRTTELDTSDEFYDREVLSTILDTLSNAEWYACCTYQADDAALESYGLLEPAMTITVKYTQKSEEKEFTINFGNVESELYRYANIEGSKLVYLADATIFDYFDYTDADWAALRGETIAETSEGE